MIKFFESIGNIISSIVSFVISIINSGIEALMAIPKHVSILFQAIDFIPSQIAFYFVAAIAFLVIWFILGRT